MWLNLLVLLGVTFIPFPTALLGGHAADRFAGVFYTASLTAVSLLFAVLWTHPRAAGHALDDPGAVSVFTVRTTATTLLFIGAVVVAMWLPYIATLTWLACLPLLRTAVTTHLVRRPMRTNWRRARA